MSPLGGLPPSWYSSIKMERKLQDLPTELLEFIVDHLPSNKDREELWQVSTRFRELLAQRVFETLTIHARDSALVQLGERPYEELEASEPLDCLKMVKHLHLTAPFRYRIGYLSIERCPHNELHGPGYVNVYKQVQYDESVLCVPNFIRLSSQLQENGLRSFSWDLGMCIPGHILGREGYLTKKQIAIESLSLITAGHMDLISRGRTVHPLVLSNFPQLRKFSWKKLRLTEELNSLRDFFARNCRILEDLELDFISWDYVEIDGKDTYATHQPPSFTDRILPHNPSGKIKSFRSLKRLALSAFGFEDSARGISKAFIVPCLRVLKLHNCRGILIFLSTIVNAGAAALLKLKSLELIMKDHAVERDDGTMESPLTRFLQSFKGLEELYLMLHSDIIGPDRWVSCYWDSILHHSSTLKRLIYHERALVPPDPDTAIISFGDLYADNTLYRSPSSDDDTTDSYINHVYNTALAQMQLECFGIADPDCMANIIMGTPSAVEKTFKLLHIRRTANDFDVNRRAGEMRFVEQIHAIRINDPSSWSHNDWLRWKARPEQMVFKFARLIFESPKFNSLQVLAFGDFSYGCRYHGFYLLLCRAVTPYPEIKFRVMSPTDIAAYKRSGLLDFEFLAACPRHGLDNRPSEAQFP